MVISFTVGGDLAGLTALCVFLEASWEAALVAQEDTQLFPDIVK